MRHISPVSGRHPARRAYITTPHPHPLLPLCSIAVQTPLTVLGRSEIIDSIPSPSTQSKQHARLQPQGLGTLVQPRHGRATMGAVAAILGGSEVAARSTVQYDGVIGQSSGVDASTLSRLSRAATSLAATVYLETPIELT